jgi:hypothetical protein
MMSSNPELYSTFTLATPRLPSLTICELLQWKKFQLTQRMAASKALKTKSVIV